VTVLLDTDDAPRAAPRRTSSGSQHLFAALYDDLRQLAERQLRRNGSRAPMSAHTLLHETYLEVARRDGLRFPDRARFLGYAARAMRGILVDRVRRLGARKRGGGDHEVTLKDDVAGTGHHGGMRERLRDALEQLAAAEPALAELVELHAFQGFGLGEIAGMRAVSERTVQRDWRRARALLQGALGG
jgi:RNA polymerase sigma factor (TIGR02999 family)